MSFDRPSSDHDDASADEARLRADARTEAGIAPDDIDPDDDGVLYEDQVQPEYGILGFTLRELIIIGAWLVGFVVSFFPIGPIGDTVWTSGIHWILMMGAPTVAVFLIVLRRLSPDGIRRVGSLGIDQFASVTAAVAAVSWAQVLWQQIAATIETGVLLIGWVAVVGQLATLVLVAATVFAPLLPRLREDFHGRLETLAHRNANPVRPVISRPRAERESAPPPADSAAATARAEHVDPAAQPAAGEPRVETALTMVIPGATPVPDARDRASASDHASAPDAWDAASASTEAATIQPSAAPAEPGFAESDVVSPGPEFTSPEPEAVSPAPEEAAPAPEPVAPEPAAPEPEPLPTSEPAAVEPEPVADDRDDDTEVLYNTAAVEALQSIFADEARDPGRPVEHNTAPDGMAGTAEIEPSDADEQSLRRGRGEQAAESDHFGQPEPFWVLAPTERDVLDERGRPLFRIGPTAWALALEDRGGAFVVRHEDGRIGYLHDISDITKG
ncbi:hypothetical protein CW368_02755 [Actinomycetales bacterium SN12]|nr:hypothetical protein CW368_02755 [Actinomycetales bacterium SN12]